MSVGRREFAREFFQVMKYMYFKNEFKCLIMVLRGNFFVCHVTRAQN